MTIWAKKISPHFREKYLGLSYLKHWKAEVVSEQEQWLGLINYYRWDLIQGQLNCPPPCPLVTNILPRNQKWLLDQWKFFKHASLPLFFPGANPCTLRGNVTYEGGFLDGVGVRQGGGGRFYKENDRATYICENGYSRAVLGKVTCTYNRTKGEFFWKPTPVCRHDALQAGTVEVIIFVEQSSLHTT